MASKTILRIAMDAAMLVCVFFGWWYIALPIGVIALFRFPLYVELVVAGFAYDSLFGMGAASFAGTIVALSFLALAAALKGSIR